MKARHYILIGIILFALGLRLVRLSWPAAPVFDEAHFATYAADYLNDRTFFDIHPPLGKLIYAAALYAANGGEPLAGAADFVAFNAGGKPDVVRATGIPFGSFPYVPLRAVSAAFGALLVLAFYWFLRSAGIGGTGALLGAFFVAADNALVLQTKLILMDGMYLAFGFLALALYFRRPRLPVAAGVLFALSLGVKLIGVVFLGPVVIDYFLSVHGRGKTEERAAVRRLAQFLVTAAVVFLAIAFLNFLFFSPRRILLFADYIGMQVPAVASPVGNFLLASAETTIIPWTGYLQGGSGPHASPWYGWPVMQLPMQYYGSRLVLFGNPALWLGSTLAVIFSIALFPRYLRRLPAKERRTFSLLLGGYAAALLPFFTFVQRQTFLYHYFPALLFAFGLLAWFIARRLGFGSIAALTRRQRFLLLMVALIVGAGFLAAAPFTYGL